MARQCRDRKPPCERGGLTNIPHFRDPFLNVFFHREGTKWRARAIENKMIERQHTHMAAMAGIGNGNQRPWRKSKANLVGHKVFLGGLDRSSTGNSIMSYFSSFGETLDH